MKPLRTADDCAGAIAEIGKLDAELSKIDSQLKIETADAKARAEAAATPLQATREQIAAQVERFCVKRRETLTEGLKRKFVEFATGRVGWRSGKDKVEIDPAKADAILSKIRTGALKRFLRVTETINAARLLDEPEAAAKIDGVTIVPAQETFYIKPAELELATGKPR